MMASILFCVKLGRRSWERESLVSAAMTRIALYIPYKIHVYTVKSSSEWFKVLSGFLASFTECRLFLPFLSPRLSKNRNFIASMHIKRTAKTAVK